MLPLMTMRTTLGIVSHYQDRIRKGYSDKSNSKSSDEDVAVCQLCSLVITMREISRVRTTNHLTIPLNSMKLILMIYFLAAAVINSSNKILFAPINNHNRGRKYKYKFMGGEENIEFSINSLSLSLSLYVCEIFDFLYHPK